MRESALAPTAGADDDRADIRIAFVLPRSPLSVQMQVSSSLGVMRRAARRLLCFPFSQRCKECETNMLPPLSDLDIGVVVKRQRDPDVDAGDPVDIEEAERALRDASTDIMKSVLDPLFLDLTTNLPLAEGGYLDNKIHVDATPVAVPFVGRVHASLELVKHSSNVYTATSIVAIRSIGDGDDPMPPADRLRTAVEHLDLRWIRPEEVARHNVDDEHLKALQELLGRQKVTQREMSESDQRMFDILTGDDTPIPQTMIFLRSLGFLPTMDKNWSIFNFPAEKLPLAKWMQDTAVRETRQKKRDFRIIGSVIETAKIAQTFQQHVFSELTAVLWLPTGEAQRRASRHFVMLANA